MISNVLARILGDGQSEPDRLSAREVMMQDEATARNGPLSTRKIKMVSERSKESQGGADYAVGSKQIGCAEPTCSNHKLPLCRSS
jgi:hypothetical protein